MDFFKFLQEAEELHQRAIRIKTDLLGPYDYEVGLSIGHLASLYGYHMKKYREAEELYLKSIGISAYLLISLFQFMHLSLLWNLHNDFVGYSIFD